MKTWHFNLPVRSESCRPSLPGSSAGCSRLRMKRFRAERKTAQVKCYSRHSTAGYMSNMNGYQTDQYRVRRHDA